MLGAVLSCLSSPGPTLQPLVTRCQFGLRLKATTYFGRDKQEGAPWVPSFRFLIEVVSGHSDGLADASPKLLPHLAARGVYAC